MVVFLVATLLILTAVAAPNFLTQGQRDREEETVWRGQQYQRAILLYFRKFGKYPTKVEDLTTQTNGLRFLRQAYTDPTNKEDGSWRFIYAGPNGQLIGSLTRTTLQHVAGQPTPPPPPPPSDAAACAGPQSASASGAASGASASSSMESQPQPLQGAVIGGNIVGVGGKVKQCSFLVYQGGTSYELWEFIANPTGQGVYVPPPATQLTPGTSPGPGGSPLLGPTPQTGTTPPPTNP